jgi:hypothetical protein
VFDACTWIFGVLFTLEAILKIGAMNARYFKDPLNWLDFGIVVMWIVETSTSVATSKAQFARMLRGIKLLRLIRVFRNITRLDGLFVMTNALKGSVAALLWATIILFIAFVFVALSVWQTLATLYFPDADQPLEQRQEIYIYFGTFIRALFSIFELTFANWPNIARLLSEYVSEWFVPLMMAYKMTLGFAVVGVLNGVFIQQTFKTTEADDLVMLRQKASAVREHETKMAKLFECADTTPDGVLTPEEVLDVLSDKNVTMWMAAMGIRVSVEDGDKLFDLLDADRNGVLTIDELVEGVSMLKGYARSLDMELLTRKVSHIQDKVNEIRKAQQKTVHTDDLDVSL